jgi:hypothetical protein
MKDTPHTARFAVTRTYSSSYDWEADKRSHGKSRFTDVGCISLQEKGVLNPSASYSKTIAFHWFYEVCDIMHCVYVWGYQYVCNPRFLRHVEITPISKFFILPRLIMDIVMLDSVLLLNHGLIIIWRWRHKFIPKCRYLAAVQHIYIYSHNFEEISYEL